MKALVVYESVYGNTRRIAEAVGEGLPEFAEVSLSRVHEAPDPAKDVDMLAVGGPTHMHGLSTGQSGKIAAEPAKEETDVELEPGATAEPGLRRWLGDLSGRKDARAASFDTRLDRPAVFTGAAARGIARRLRRPGYEVAGAESFLVEDSEGPLAEGELERARTWGRRPWRAHLRRLKPKPHRAPNCVRSVPTGCGFATSGTGVCPDAPGPPRT